LYVLSTNEALFSSRSDYERTGGERVDTPRHAACGLEDSINGRVLEHRLLFTGTCGVQASEDVLTRFIVAERIESGNGGDALVQGVVCGVGETVIERGLSG